MIYRYIQEEKKKDFLIYYVLHLMMDEVKMGKVCSFLEMLPAEEMKVIIKKYSPRAEVSSKVSGLLKLFNKLSPEEQNEFYRNAINKDSDGELSNGGDESSSK